MSILDRVKNVLFLPKKAWDEIELENQTPASLMVSYLLPLMLIPIIAIFISYGIIGYKVPFLGYVCSYEMAVRQALMTLLSTVIGIFVTAFIIDVLAPSFGAEKNFNNSFKLVIYSYTPSLVGGVFLFYYATAILTGLLGFYGLYILYMGLKPMMKVKEEQHLIYFIISLLATIGVFVVLSFLLTTILIGNSMMYSI